MARTYRIELPYTIPSWMLAFAINRINGANLWTSLSHDLATKVDQAARNKTDLIVTREDLDGLSDETWAALDALLP
jgi:hypothetical protein